MNDQKKIVLNCIKIALLFIFIIVFSMNHNELSLKPIDIDEKYRGDNLTPNPQSLTYHENFTLIGNDAIDEYCSGNGTTGLSYESAHKFENYCFNGSYNSGVILRNISRWVIFRNCTFSNQSAFQLIGSLDLQNCSNLILSNCQFQNNTFGFAARNCTNLVIEKTQFLGNFYTMYLNLTNYMVINQISIEYTSSTLAIYNSTQLNFKDVIFNVPTANHGSFINSENIRFENFTIKGKDFGFISCNNIIIQNTTALNCAFGANTVKNIKIENLNFTAYDMYQIASPYGVWFSLIENISISNSNFQASYNLTQLVYFYQTEDLTITRCKFTNPGQIGVKLFGDTNNITINQNQFQNCSNGTYIENMQSLDALNYIYKNNFTECQTGMFLANSTINIKIWLNNFDQNINNSLCDGQNTWSLDGEGNYWGDYQSRYPSAVATNGIWNTSYMINESITENDSYPLQYPVNIINNTYQCNTPPDIAYNRTSTGHFIQWNIKHFEEPFYHSILIQKNGNTIFQSTYTNYSRILGKNPAYNYYQIDVSWNVDGLLDGNYSFTMTLLNASGSIMKTDAVLVQVLGILPATPSITTQDQTIAPGLITITWQAVDNCSSYRLYINGTYNLTITTTFNSAQLNLTQNGLYQITVTAVNEIGESPQSNICLITVQSSDNNSSDSPPIPTLYYIIGGGVVLIGIPLLMKMRKRAK